MPTVRLTVDATSARKQRNALMARLAVAAPRAVAAAAVDIGIGIQAAYNGDNTIRRVDTTRARESWLEAIWLAADEPVPGSGPAMVEMGDAQGIAVQDRHSSHILISSTVPYVPYLEYGTVNEDGSVRMHAGYHVNIARFYRGKSAVKAARKALRAAL
jgi:hypothetical protein